MDLRFRDSSKDNIRYLNELGPAIDLVMDQHVFLVFIYACKFGS